MRSADRVKVQIGVSRSQREVVGDSLTRMNCIGTSEGSSNDSGISTKQEEEAAVAAAAFPTSAPLVNLCSSSFLRKKRKLDTIPAKVLTVDSDYKLKRSAASIQAEEQDNGTGNDLISADARDIGPRVEIINGQIVLKESSLTIANQDSVIAEGEYEEIEEGVHASSRYSSFLTKRKSKSWGIEETRDFYRALQQCGTEFSIMETFFPSRSRKELKLKFFREENQHPELVKRALDSTVPLDLETFEDKFREKL